MSEKMFRFFVFWRFCFECSSEMGKEINYLVMAILLIGMVLLLGGGYGLYSIRQAEKAYESTVGIVKRVVRSRAANPLRHSPAEAQSAFRQKLKSPGALWG